MYLRLDKDIELIELGKRLLPEANEESFCWDYENVYEWMYVDLPSYGFSLNISRDHGMSDIDDELLDKYQDYEEALKGIVTPGPIYIFGWYKARDTYVDELPESLIVKICKRLNSDIALYEGRINVEFPDAEPVSIYKVKELK